MLHSWNPSTQEAGTQEPEVQGYPWLHTTVEASYMRLCLLEKQLGLLMDVDQECACCLSQWVLCEGQFGDVCRLFCKFIEKQGQS